MDAAGSGQGPVEGSCEHGDEPSGFVATELAGQYNVSSRFPVAIHCTIAKPDLEHEPLRAA
jgi:hypothetical protein